MSTLLSSFLIGLSFAMPLGAQNIFVMRSSMFLGIRGLGKIICVVGFFDILLVFFCFYGIGEVVSFLPQFVQTALLFFGAIYLINISIEIYLKRHQAPLDQDAPPHQSKEFKFRALVRSFFILTFINPQAIIDGTLLIGNLRQSTSTESQHLVLIGLCAASLIWFSLLSFSMAKFKNVIGPLTWKYISYFCITALSLISLRFFFKGFKSILVAIQ